MSRSLAAALAVGTALASLPALAGPDDTAFSRFYGAWAGDGTIASSAGNVTKVTCQGWYDPDGTSMGLRVICDTGRYKVDLAGKFDSEAGRLSGAFHDTKYHIPGEVAGSASTDTIAARVTGMGLAGRMNVRIRGQVQSVALVPETPGTGVRYVAITMTRRR